ncbi:MAG: hypothetical protein AAF206_27385, partial [Bacteroidota bacterium]
MIRIYRIPFVLKLFVAWVMVSHLAQILVPSISFAFTGGPGTPESSSFEPAGLSSMVDLATGDFMYNIPLLDVEGYPINLSYHSG